MAASQTASPVSGADYPLQAAEIVGQVFVAFRPLCDSLGVDPDSQAKKLRSRSWATTVLKTVVAAHDQRAGGVGRLCSRRQNDRHDFGDANEKGLDNLGHRSGRTGNYNGQRCGWCGSAATGCPAMASPSAAQMRHLPATSPP